MDGSPVWSPDGDYLYFASDRAGSMNLWRVPINEQTGKVLGSPEAITTPSPYVSQLSFSRDGHRMAYVNSVHSGNIERVGFDPLKETVMGDPVGITQGTRLFFVPDLSPDGDWLVFDTQTDKQEDIYVAKRDGTRLHQLTDDAYKDRGARWSPDGKRLAFFSDRSGKWEIWMINADASGLQQITHATAAVINPIWSPDGTRMVYRNAGSNPSIMEVGKPWLEQTPQTLPSMSDGGRAYMSSWSPDGRRIAGYEEHSGVPPAGVVVYSLNEQKYDKLTDFGIGPIWLSDNRRLLFINHSKLYLLDSESKKFHELMSVAPHEFGYRVTVPRDDRQIYFSRITVEADIWMMTLE
jgi:Tol biopolymer transport system component